MWTDGPESVYADPDPDRSRIGAGWHRFVLHTGDLYKGPVTM